MVTIWLSCSLDKTQVIFWNNLKNSEIKKKNDKRATKREQPKEGNQKSVGPFPLATSRTRDV